MALYDLLVVDPQNDFLDIAGAALPVPGANADMSRLSQWLQVHADQVNQVTVTLDSHASVGIERTTFWQQADGSDVAPFTVITLAAMQAGRFLPRHMAHRAQALDYLRDLESSPKRQLVVWPVHCVVGTPGHNIHAGLADSLAHWEFVSGRTCDKVIKGQNPLTEQYSAFRAEVPRGDDVRTQNNVALMDKFRQGHHRLLVAGEAMSHCVAETVQDMMAQLPAHRLTQMVLLTDCMSPVSGCEVAAQTFLSQARLRGLQTQTLAELSAAA